MSWYKVTEWSLLFLPHIYIPQSRGWVKSSTRKAFWEYSDNKRTLLVWLIQSFSEEPDYTRASRAALTRQYC